MASAREILNSQFSILDSQFYLCKMKRTNYFIPLLLVALIVGLIVMDCRRKPANKEVQPSVTLRGEALGTIYQITAIGSLPDNFGVRLDSLFTLANSSMSIFDQGSLLSRINRGETNVADDHIVHCIEIAQNVSQLSDGAYDITIKPLVEAFGFAGKNLICDSCVGVLLLYKSGYIKACGNFQCGAAGVSTYSHCYLWFEFLDYLLRHSLAL